MSEIQLLLFDVDGTLVLGDRANRRWFGDSLVEVYGTAGRLDGHSFSGKIDPQIVHELMTEAGIAIADIEAGLPRMKEAYLSRLRRNLGSQHLRLLPHVVELLERLQSRQEVAMGLLTGNWEEGARTKLECFDLNRFFPFGAFSDGHRARGELPPVALQRAGEATERQIPASQALIVGDSVLDVECAQLHGMKSLAVATGYTAMADLQAASPDWAIQDLGDAHRVDPIFRL